MKTIWIPLLAVGIAACVLVIGSDFALAQGRGNGNGGGNGGGGSEPPQPSLIQYRAEYVIPPEGTVVLRIEDVKEVNNGVSTSILAVGHYRKDVDPAGTSRGFVYDRGTGTFHDINQLLGLGDTWDRTRCFAVNKYGIVVGYVRAAGGLYQPVWFDFLASSPTLHLLEDVFPEVDSNTVGLDLYCFDVNDNGDMLIVSQLGFGLQDQNFLLNPLTLESAEFSGFSAHAVNDSRVVVGKMRIPNATPEAVKYDVSTDNLSVFPQYFEAMDINNADQFCGVMDVSIKRNRTARYAYMHQGSNPNDDPNWLSQPFEIEDARSLNSEGDVVGVTGDGKSFLYHASLDSVFKLDDLVDDQFFVGMQPASSFAFVIERDSSMVNPSPIVVTGSGNNAGEDYRLIFLIPEDTP